MAGPTATSSFVRPQATCLDANTATYGVETDMRANSLEWNSNALKTTIPKKQHNKPYMTRLNLTKWYRLELQSGEYALMNMTGAVFTNIPEQKNCRYLNNISKN